VLAGGWNSEDHFTQVAVKLYDLLGDKGIKCRDDVYYTASYDSPFRLMDRHNEVRYLDSECIFPLYHLYRFFDPVCCGVARSFCCSICCQSDAMLSSRM
jgi:SOUL heme-binding protein